MNGPDAPPTGGAAPAARGEDGGRRSGPPAVRAAATAGDRVITVAEVDRRLRLLRSGPLAARLPRPETAEGRNLRRWLVQVMVAEALAEQEAARLGLPAGHPAPPGPRAVLTPAGALRTGGVAAAVLVTTPAARAVCRALSAGREPSEEEVRDYYRRNLDRFTTPETRWVLPFGAVRRGEIAGPLEDAVFAAREGETIGPVEGPGGPWTLVVERIEAARREPYAAVRERIRAELAKENEERAFARWLDARHADAVVLTPGHEHPADPAQPDADHRH
ncbi:peptidylprolyl isomerase [Microbispora sp. KK1-11]|uniref:peptidylprolyl isomerase n=1 Tax=Microbispora sp. KK1-11 TaxID=2053005 RepID=UPI001159DB1B|nr:peptidylprolyl isomerase [Microbispora sp. KK1-11]TQS28503.1 peptidyl-prolyl cis-trans isomerase [Microbispora sp. KK1-11]